ncbi:Nn.00g019230.m01.CDS01 [Neocucurbitaria sp. VM-36]
MAPHTTSTHGTRRTHSPPTPVIHLRGFVAQRLDPEYEEARKATGNSEPYWFQEELVIPRSHSDYDTGSLKSQMEEMTEGIFEEEEIKARTKRRGTTQMPLRENREKWYLKVNNFGLWGGRKRFEEEEEELTAGNLEAESNVYPRKGAVDALMKSVPLEGDIVGERLRARIEGTEKKNDGNSE